MKAWRIESHGSADSLKLQEVNAPKLEAGQALVRVRAIALNHLDLWVRKGVPGHTFPLPLIPGSDALGVIEKKGEGPSPGLEGGTPVLIQPIFSCRRCRACMEDLDFCCEKLHLFGESQDGGCAEQIVVPFENLVPLPASILQSPEKLAALVSLPTAYVTAWNMLKRRARLRPSETVLIQAGGSGVGVAAIQIAKLIGSTVITTVGSPEKEKKAKNLQADCVINYSKNPFREEIKKFLKTLPQSPSGVDVVVDHVGVETMKESLRCLRPGGRLVTCGATTGSKIELDLKPIFFKSIEILGATMGSRIDLPELVSLVLEGKLKPVVDRVFPFAQLKEAHEHLEGRKAFGKVVLTVP